MHALHERLLQSQGHKQASVLMLIQEEGLQQVSELMPSAGFPELEI